MNKRRAAAALLAATALSIGGCSADTSAPGTQRTVLLAPDFVAHAARGSTDDPQARWLLGQPHDVRAGYVHEVIDKGGDTDLRATAWLLRQPDSVRQSYLREVVEPKLGP